MKRLVFATMVAALSSFAVSVMLGAPAGAQQTCSGTQTASPGSLNTSTINAGDSLTVTGGGFAANVVLSVGIAQPAIVLATVASDANGNYSAVITTPREIPSGQNQVIVFGRGPIVNTVQTCHQSIALFAVNPRPIPTTPVYQQPIYVQPVAVASPLVTTAPVAGAPLARTGSSSSTLAVAGFGGVFLGGILLMLSRPARRRREAAAF